MQAREPYVQLTLNIDPSPIRHSLIDEEFDAEFANRLAELEAYNKHLYRPNTYLHKWWARRCGTTFRAILKHLVTDSSKSDYYAPGGLEEQIILDPMMGGGTTLHEAIRLGANVIGADIDPIPILQARATLTEVPPKKLENEFLAFFRTLHSKLGHYYRTSCPYCEQPCEQRFVLYGVHRQCECEQAIFVDDFVLRHNSDGSVVRISPDTYDILHGDRVVSKCSLNHNLPLYNKERKMCVRGEPYKDDGSIPYYQRYVPLVIVGECPEHNLFFAAPRASDLKLIQQADAARASLDFCQTDFSIVPGPKSIDLVNRGIQNYLELFSGRQLLYLRHAIDELGQVDPPVRLKLAMLVSTSIEFNSMLCGYKGAGANRPGAIRHTFAHHAYSFPYTALENNPLHPSRSSGTLHNLFYSRLARGQEWALNPVERRVKNGKSTTVSITGEVDFGAECTDIANLQEGTRRFLLIQGSSARLKLPDQSIDHIVTDPPYFDSVQYSDLAAFFRVWLRRLLPTEVQWDYALGEAAVDQQDGHNGQYETVLSGILAECHRVLKDASGRLIFTFHHWNPKGWAGLTIALKKAGFVLINRYVIYSENPTSVHIANQNALVHDVVLVLGKAGASRGRDWRAPDVIDRQDSFKFCEQCGALLGSMLGSTLADEDIHRLWREKLS